MPILTLPRSQDMNDLPGKHPQLHTPKSMDEDQGSPVVCIVPRGAGGVADYATLLAAALGVPAKLEPFDPMKRLNGERVILHYSGYGYSRWGAPADLLRWVSSQKSRLRALGTHFHETYATGPVYRSAFWVSALQQRVARELARRSTFWVSSIEVASRWLELQAPGVAHATLGICSTIGEAQSSLANRENIVVVFGGAALRAATWMTHGIQLCLWAKERNLRLHDVGPPLRHADLERLFGSNKVVCHGLQPPADVCALLARARAGVLAYPTHCLAKSSVFAAYCAHSLPPIVLGSQTGTFDGLLPGVNFFSGLPMGEEQLLSLSRVGDAARHWYAAHDLESHARLFRAHLGLSETRHLAPVPPSSGSAP